MIDNYKTVEISFRSFITSILKKMIHDGIYSKKNQKPFFYIVFRLSFFISF